MSKIYSVIIWVSILILMSSCKTSFLGSSKVFSLEGEVKEISNATIREFSLKSLNDTIDFVVTSDNFEERKPVLIYLQGSTPVPIGVRYGNTQDNSSKVLVAYSFLEDSTLNLLKKSYHLVVISMPKTPLFAPIEDIYEPNVWYVKSKEPEVEFYQSYHESNVLDNYVRRTNVVIDYLAQKNWVDVSHISLFGHSQGAKVAVKVAEGNKKVNRICFSGGNPFGRMDHIVRGYRYDALLGKKSHEEAQANIDLYYQIWNDIVKYPNSNEVKYADANRAYLSFEENLIPVFLRVKQPIYVCYGTVDPKAVMCDVLPFYFATAKKTNLTMKPYPGLEHNYYEVNEMLDPIGISKMGEVLKSFIEWDFAVKK